jgi:hypothetical protein
MTARRVHIPHFWLSDWSLSALLIVLAFNIFILGPLANAKAAPEWLSPLVRTVFLIAAIMTVLHSRVATAIVCALAVADFAVRWTNHVHPRVALESADAWVSLLLSAVLTAVILARAFSPGRINLHRVQGAVAAYLLLALIWTFAYKLVALADPAAFSFSATGMQFEYLTGRLGYFSAITLTTVGYGDITPVSPVARSLAMLEGFTGQLFPAITLARLVAMELYHKQHND